MICALCQRPNPDDAAFCAGCGRPLALPCPACKRPNPADASFCNGCGQRLARDAPAAAPERDPRDYTPRHLAEKILSSKSALEGERKQVTVLFADVKGSMELAEQVDPEEWHRLMDRFFQILADGVHRFEGTVNQYTGDGIMALFGAPIAHEDHAQRACYAALWLTEKLREYGQELRREHGLDLSVRLGLNSGQVIVGKIGDDLRMDYTAQGHTVGLAARLEQLAEAGKPYLSPSTAALVRGYFELEELGEFKLKGVAEPVHAFGLVAVGRMRTRLDVARARGFSKFVGRAAEMATLEAALERALAGDGQVVGVVAEAGVGKSRLCFEFVERCRARGLLVRQVYGVAHGKTIPLLPVLELFRQAFGITPRDTDREARQKIAGEIVLMDEGLREALPLFFEFLGVPDPDRPPPPMAPEVRQRRILELSKRFSLARSRREPAVLVFEDLHWIDPATEAFVEALADASEGARTLILVNFRPEYRAEWMHRSYYQQIALRPLDASAVDELLDDWLGAHASLAGLASRIRDRTGGNPFFVEEIVQSAIEAGALVGARGSYRLARAVEQIEMPATVESVLAARIDRLGEREKRLLQTASVIGKEFSESLIQRIADAPSAELSQALRSLVQREFLYEQALYPELEYAFKHPLTCEVAYGSQLRERRARVHAELAKALEELHAHERDEKAALIARHWEAAGDALAAARWHHRAARWIGGRHPAATREHFARVRELLDGVPDSPETLSLALETRAQLLLYEMRLPTRPEEVERLFREGREIAERSDDQRGLALLLNHRGYVEAINSGAGDYLPALEEARSIADRLGDPGLRILVRYSLAFACLFSGRCRMETGARLCDEILEIAAGDLDLGYELVGVRPSIGSLYHRASYAAAMGDLEAARRDYDRTIELARDRDDVLLSNLAHAFYVYQPYCVDLLAPEAALQHAQRSLEYAEQSGGSVAFVLAHWALGKAHDLNGRPDHAIRELEHVLALGRERRDQWGGKAFVLCDLAQAYLAAGDPRARDAIQEANRCRARGFEGARIDVASARVWLRSEGLAARREVERALENGFALIEKTGAIALDPELRVERAELARLLGDRAARERELREAHRLFVRMGAPRRAEQVAREIGP